MKERPLVPWEKYGRWTALRRVRAGIWIARCACGTEREVRAIKLLSGWSKSCGCYKRDATIARMTKHGMSRGPDGKMTPEWATWSHIKSRCYNSKVARYPRYGGRGIRMCDRWLGDCGFENFLADMGKRPGRGYSIERRNNDGDYEPGNCAWISNKAQARNRSTAHLIAFRGETLSVRDWSRRTGLPDHVISRRIKQLGWPTDRALTEPRARNGAPRRRHG